MYCNEYVLLNNNVVVNIHVVMNKTTQTNHQHFKQNPKKTGA